MKSAKGLDVELPVMEIVRDASWSLMSNRQVLLSRFLPVMLVLGCIDWAASQFLPKDDLRQIFPFVISIAISILFATAAHRLTLRSSRLLAERLWQKSETRYLLYGFYIGIVMALTACLAILLAVVVLGQQGLMVGAVLGLMLALYVTARLSIVLPEIALGGTGTLKRAWDLSNGNGSRLVLVVWILPILSSSPFLLMYFGDHMFMRLLAAFGIYVMTLFSLVTLSLSYRFLADYADSDEQTHDDPANGLDA